MNDIDLKFWSPLQTFCHQVLSLCHMGKMNIIICDDTKTRFRDAVARYRGVRKGNISKALEEAIELWIRHFDNVIFTI